MLPSEPHAGSAEELLRGLEHPGVLPKFLTVTRMDLGAVSHNPTRIVLVPRRSIDGAEGQSDPNGELPPDLNWEFLRYRRWSRGPGTYESALLEMAHDILGRPERFGHLAEQRREAFLRGAEWLQRLSVGIEDAEDLIADLHQALERSGS